MFEFEHRETNFGFALEVNGHMYKNKFLCHCRWRRKYCNKLPINISGY